MRGLEPPHPCGYTLLKRARLPIPPHRQVKRATAIENEQSASGPESNRRAATSAYGKYIHYQRKASWKVCQPLLRKHIPRLQLKRPLVRALCINDVTPFLQGHAKVQVDRDIAGIERLSNQEMIHG